MALSKNKTTLAVLLLATAVLSGCADYMNRWDRVSMRAGNSQDANSAIQVIDPFPQEANNANIWFGG